MPGEGGGGGAGGMDWAALGSQILNDSLSSMTFFSDLMNQEEAKRFRDKSFNEDRRQFEKRIDVYNRDANLKGIDALRDARMLAEGQSRMRKFMVKLTG